MTDDDNAELVYYAPQQIGSINPHTLECPSCNAIRRVKQLGGDTWYVILEHEDSCLRMRRGLGDPQAN